VFGYPSCGARRSAKRDDDADDSVDFEATTPTATWHFIDVVWIVIVTLLYLAP
jgi:heme/copper-type cytochrome/quinol oxidase subunit 3